MPKGNQNEEPSSQGTATENQPTSEEEEQNGDSGQVTSTDPSTGGQTDFRHPALRGRSPDEIEGLFEIMESAVREQGTELNSLQRKMKEFEERTQRPPQPDEQEVDFYDNPQAAIRREVESTMKSMMEPFMEDLRTRRVTGARERMRQKYDDWDEVEPYVDTLLTQQGLGDQAENTALLDSLYYMAHGLIAKRKRSDSQPQPTREPQEQGGTRMQAPPQHRPSNAPIPSGGGEKKELRKLTESERALAREWGMSHEEYIRWQDEDPRNVAESSIGVSEDQ